MDRGRIKNIECHYKVVAFKNYIFYLCVTYFEWMTKFEKLISRFLTRPKDFKYSELKRMLSGFGYVELQGSGSRVVFFNDKIKHSIKLHKPYPENLLKTYQVDLVLNELKSKDLI
mgnify:CR=1 FL=1